MLVVERDSSALRLSFNGRLFLKHSADAPCLTLGHGQGVYRMRHGSFRIRDAGRTTQALGEVSVQTATPTSVRLCFGSGAHALLLCADVVAGRLVLSFEGARPEHNRLCLVLQAEPTEHVYGCGEQYSRLDLKGSAVPLWVEEQGVGRGHDLITFLADLAGGAGGAWYTTYFPQPTFVSSAGYYCHADCSAYSWFDFREPERHTLWFWDIPRRITLGVQGRALELLADLTALLGRQPPLPDWTFDGLWLGVQGGEAAVRHKLGLARAAGVPVKAVWVQDWVGRRQTAVGSNLRWNWKPDTTAYPDLRAFIAELARDGTHFLGYINSFLAPEGDLFAEAEAKGFLVKNAAGATYRVKAITFPVGIVDLTHPQARAWLKGVIKKNLLDLGMKGYMADFGEHLPVDATLYSKESAEHFHNRYPVAWAELNRELLAESGLARDVVFFSRSGFSGTSAATPLLWAGDQNVDWSRDDGLPTVIPAALSLGFCGIGHTHFDLGGYTTVLWIKRRREVLWRWAEAAAFSPVMRSHEGLRPKANHQVYSDAATLAHVARMARVFVGMKPYLQYTAAEYQHTGAPMMRHPFVHYERDLRLHAEAYQYLLGRDLLVAPVLAPRCKSGHAVLPDDEWIHLWTGQHFRGGACEVPAPLGQPPVFFRKESAFAELFSHLPALARG